jgi:hypothetical protein
LILEKGYKTSDILLQTNFVSSDSLEKELMSEFRKQKNQIAFERDKKIGKMANYGGMMAKGGEVHYDILYKKIVEAVERKLKISDEEATNLVDENEAFIIDMIEHEEIKNPNQIADAIISDYGEANDEMAKGGRVKRKRWIQDALSGNKGELRKTAKRKGLIKGDEKLSKSDLHKLEKMGGKTSRRAHLAETLIDFKK